MFNFQRLTVYEKSIALSIELSKTAAKFPYSYKRIQDQLIGAVISISLNIAEGSGRFNQKEKTQFYRIAQASAFELVAIIDICHGLKLLDKNEWMDRVEETCKMISGLIKSNNGSKSPKN